jgi:hypothetical protein
MSCGPAISFTLVRNIDGVSPGMSCTRRSVATAELERLRLELLGVPVYPAASLGASRSLCPWPSPAESGVMILADKRGEEAFEQGSSMVALVDVSSDDDSLRAIDLGTCTLRFPAFEVFVVSRGASQRPLGEVERVEAGEPKKEDRREDDPLRPGRFSSSAVSKEPGPLKFTSGRSVFSCGAEVANTGPMVLARLRRVLFIIEDARLFCPTPFDVAGEEDKRELA